MQAKDLRIEELVDFSAGLIQLQGRRLILHDIHAFAQFRKDLLSMVGQEHAQRILTRFGYLWGQADAAAMQRIFNWSDPLEFLKAGPRLQTLQGVAVAIIKSVQWDSDTGRFSMNLVWHRSGEAVEHLAEIGPSKDPVCWILVGYISGFMTYGTGQEIYFVERSCRAQGKNVCVAEGFDLASWGTDILPYLPYFQSDGIQDKIQRLTQEIELKNRALARARRHPQIQKKTSGFPPVEVRSAVYARVLDSAVRVAPFDTSVFITGESGVGKEVLARYIHSQSARSEQPFVVINCSALPETLLEGELFGYKAGAFTGARQDRKGIFEEADSGTIFLDEIGDITPATQLKLLRVLQEREVVRLGENRPRKIDVRVIAATHRDIKKCVAEQSFREDLYYRLIVVEIEIPPLRARPEDIIPLARYLTKNMGRKFKISGLKLSPQCLEYLQSYPWPGNIRELENALERAAVYSQDGIIQPEHLPPTITQPSPLQTIQSEKTPMTLAELEKQYIHAVLEQTGQNRSCAAKILGISTTTLWRKLKTF
nr:sigma-54-dependent Fis family transcriptional regulator [uncultured Desulfobacter sp.]